MDDRQAEQHAASTEQKNPESPKIETLDDTTTFKTITIPKKPWITPKLRTLEGYNAKATPGSGADGNTNIS